MSRRTSWPSPGWMRSHSFRTAWKYTMDCPSSHIIGFLNSSSLIVAGPQRACRIVANSPRTFSKQPSTLRILNRQKAENDRIIAIIRERSLHHRVMADLGLLFDLCCRESCHRPDGRINRNICPVL